MWVASPRQQVVRIVSDRSVWRERLSQHCEELGVFFEHLEWAEFAGIAGVFHSLCLDISSQFESRLRFLEESAKRSWQPMTVVSLFPGLGSAGVKERTSTLGFFKPVLEVQNEQYWEQIRTALRQLLERDGWIVAMVLSFLRCNSPEVLEVLWTATDQSVEPTVEDVTRLLRETPDDLRERFAKHGLPAPKTVLQWQRLARAVAIAQSHQNWSRDQVARKLGYGTGDYLGKRAVFLTRLSFRKLVQLGPSETLALAMAVKEAERESDRQEREKDRRSL